MTETIEDLQRQVIAFRDARDWRQFHQPKDLALGLQVEAAELAELFLWKTREESRELIGEERARERLAQEMADVLIFLLYLAEETRISLPKAVRRKLATNEQKYPVERARGSAKKWRDLD